MSKKAITTKEKLLIVVMIIVIVVMLAVGFNYETVITYVNSWFHVNIGGKGSSTTKDLVTKVMEQEIDKYKAKYYHNNGLKTSKNLEKDLKEWLRIKEGKLTDNPKDSASKHPVPGTFTKLKGGKQHTSSTWHTNMGVTWTAYQDSAKEYGYTATPKNFFDMPVDLPFKIFQKKYGDAVKENSGSKMIDTFLDSWAWGSGAGGERALLKAFIDDHKKTLNQLYIENKELLFANLVLYRIRFFERLAEKKPENKGFLKGWINEALNFYYNFKQYL